MPAGAELGGMIARLEYNAALVPIGFVIGAVVVCAEPAVWVLNGQVEQVSGGHIRKKVMLVSLSVGVACSVAIAMLRVMTGWSIWWFLIPGYALALGLMRFCPQMFTAIAFDSGGVASGPMASTFILAFTLGASLLTIQILGILYTSRERKAESRRAVNQPEHAEETAEVQK